MVNLGMLVGIKVGTTIRSLFGSIFAPGANQGLIIAHAIPGRRRYQSSALRGLSQEVCSCVEKAILDSSEQISSAKVNPITGSLTVTYSFSEEDALAFFEGLSHALTGTHAQHEKSVIPTSLITASNRLNDEARAVRSQVKSFFNMAEPLFISRIAGLAFLGYGIYRMIYNGDRPSGIQLFWWGMGLLLRQSHKDLKLPSTPTSPNQLK